MGESTQSADGKAEKVNSMGNREKLIFGVIAAALLSACDSRESTVSIYNWPGAEKRAVLPRDEIREYIRSCDIILRVTCEDEFDFSPDIETQLTRRYRVQSVGKGSISAGSQIWENYYMEYTPQEIQERFGIEPQQLPCRKTVQYPESAWLCLRRSFLHQHAPREWEINRSDEAYNYHYFLYGEKMDELMADYARERKRVQSCWASGATSGQL